MFIVNSMCGRLMIMMVMLIGISVSVRNGMWLVCGFFLLLFLKF